MRLRKARFSSVGAKQATAKKCISIDFVGSFRIQTVLRGSKLPTKVHTKIEKRPFLYVHFHRKRPPEGFAHVYFPENARFRMYISC